MSDKTEEDKPTEKSSLRKRIDKIKDFRCKELISVIESPKEIKNLGTVIRNVEALGVEKSYVIDTAGHLPDDWQEMRQRKSLLKPSVSAVKWSFVRRFDSTEACLAHLEKKGFDSIVTSPHIKGKENISLEAGDYTKFKKLAVWFGNEVVGVSDLAVEHSKLCVSIPMYGLTESLNLGTSTGIVLYEITKQRRAFVQNKKHKKRYTK